MVVAGGKLYVAARTGWESPDTCVGHVPITVWSTADGTLLDQEQMASDQPGTIAVAPSAISANDAGAVVVRGDAEVDLGWAWEVGRSFEQTFQWVTTP